MQYSYLLFSFSTSQIYLFYQINLTNCSDIQLLKNPETNNWLKILAALLDPRDIWLIEDTNYTLRTQKYINNWRQKQLFKNPEKRK